MNICKKLSLYCLPCLLVACTTVPTSPPQQSSDTSKPAPTTAVTPQPDAQLAPVDQAVKANVVVLSLLKRAQQQLHSGNEQGAEASLERAIRIAPRYPHSYFQLAQLRYQQHRYQQAHSLAEKSLSLGADQALAKQAHQLVEQALAKL